MIIYDSRWNVMKEKGITQYTLKKSAESALHR